jgi:hypothetical protein
VTAQGASERASSTTHLDAPPPRAQRRARGIVLGALLFLLAFTPSLFLIPGVGVYRVLVGLADVGLLSASMYAGGRARGLALIVASGAAVVGTAALVAAWELAPLALAPSALGLAAALGLATGSARRRALFAYVMASGTAAKWLLCAAAALQAGDAARAPAKNGGVCRSDEIVRPGRRYNLVTSAAGDRVASFFPHEDRTEIHVVGAGATEPERVLPLATNRAIVAPELNRVFGVDYGHGLFALSHDDLSIVEAPPSAHSGHYFMGIALRRSARELLLLRGDGLLTHLDLDTRKPRAEVHLLASDSLKFEEEVHALYLSPDERLAAVVKSNGVLYLYDPDARRVLARRRFMGPTGNVVFSPDSARLFVATLLPGRLYELSARDLSELRGTSLGMGFRYVRLAKDGRHLLAGNYFTGNVVVRDIERGVDIASVSVGQRIQWIDAHAAGDRYWVSHADGLTLLDLPCLLTDRPKEPPSRTLADELAPSRLVKSLRSRPGAADPWILASVGLVAASVLTFVGRPARPTRSGDQTRHGGAAR